MKGKLPYFPLYVEDFEASETVRCMTVEQVGLYFLCLIHSWREGSIPADPAKLARTLRVEPKIIARSWDAVRPCWTQNGSPERLVNTRQESERIEAKKKSERARDKADKRWQSYGYATASPQHNSSSALAHTQQCYVSDSSFVSNSISHSERVFEGKPNLDFQETEVGYWKERLYARHPKKRDLVLVEHECARLWAQRNGDAVAFFREVDRVHGLWCKSGGWMKENSRYAPKLAEWLGDRGWTKVPETEDLL